MLEIRNVSFDRDGRTVLNEINLRVPRGGATAVIGPNGVGKSTLLAIVSALLAPTSGAVLVGGRPVHEWPRRELSRTVALVPQSLHVPFSFRVEEVVAQGRVPHLGRIGSLSSHDVAVIERAMDAVDVLPLRRRPFNELSGGESQRVKIAIALAQEPQLLLLDEPTQHLDIGRQLEIASLIRALNNNGLTIVASMHDLAIVRDYFNEALLLTPNGESFSGPVDEIVVPELLRTAFGSSDRIRFDSPNLAMGWWREPARKERTAPWKAIPQAGD